MKLVVIATTYNEKDNIESFVTAVMEELTKIPMESCLLIADDESPDGTGDIVKSLQAKYPSLALSSGPKSGLGNAYKRATAYAITDLSADLIVTMDADFSHAPFDIHRLVEAVVKGSDLAIGSRYVAGGAIPTDWGWHRKLLSGLGNVVVRILFGTWQVHEYTTAFRAFTVVLWSKLDHTKIDFVDNTFLPAFVYEASQQGAKIVEIPVIFKDRVAGVSKIEIGSYAPRLFKYALGVFFQRLTGH
ncbi:MAG: glycosyltransferase [candidate division WWE3 bacterium]|nr:glycosyltransferase [candidate division WWE3 bacterium]